MDSRTAAVVEIIRTYLYSSIGGISPVPVPPKAAMPYITVQEIVGTELESLGGKSGLVDSTIQVNCFHKSHELADGIRSQIKIILYNSVGEAGSGQTLVSVNHNRDFEIYDSERELHQLITRFRFWFEESDAVSSERESPVQNPSREQPVEL